MVIWKQGRGRNILDVYLNNINSHLLGIALTCSFMKSRRFNAFYDFPQNAKPKIEKKSLLSKLKNKTVYIYVYVCRQVFLHMFYDHIVALLITIQDTRIFPNLLSYKSITLIILLPVVLVHISYK
jgi:hypothetical protein